MILRKKTGRPVSCGTTSFSFEDEYEDQDEVTGLVLRYPPENVVKFTQGLFAGRYSQLYVED